MRLNYSILTLALASERIQIQSVEVKTKKTKKNQNIRRLQIIQYKFEHQNLD